MPVSRLSNYLIRRAQRKPYDRLRRWEVKRVEDFIRNNPAEAQIILPTFGSTKNIPLPGDLITTTAAYGLRKLKTDYSGFCLRIKRSSDNVTQDIGFSGTQLDSSALNTFVGGSTALVDIWYDQSDNNLNLVPVSTNPVLKKIGNIYTADFNDNLAVLINSSTISVATCFCVANHYGQSPTFANFNGLLSSVSGGISIIRAENGFSSFRSSGSPDGLFGNNLFINGVQTKEFAPLSQTKLVRGANGSSTAINGLTVARDTNDNTRIWKGQISELIIAGVLTTQQITDTESAINAYHALF